AARLGLLAVFVVPGLFRREKRRRPGGATFSWANERPERLEHKPAVAGDRDVGNAVATEFARVGMDVDQRRRGKRPVPEPEVEGRPDDADDVRVGERGAPRVLEEKRMVWRQRATARTVQEHGYLAVPGKGVERFVRAVPPDARTGHDGRSLGSGEQDA